MSQAQIEVYVPKAKVPPWTPFRSYRFRSNYLGANILSRRGLNLLSVLTGATLEDT